MDIAFFLFMDIDSLIDIAYVIGFSRSQLSRCQRIFLSKSKVKTEPLPNDIIIVKLTTLSTTIWRSLLDQKTGSSVSRTMLGIMLSIMLSIVEQRNTQAL
jgi:hypothetical protein